MKKFYFVLIAISFLVIGHLTISKVNAQFCGNASDCPGGNPCGVGSCTNWRFCSGATSCNPFGGGAEYSCYQPYNCATGPSCSPCPTGGGSPTPGFCGDGICGGSETNCNCSADCTGTCNYQAACPWDPNNPSSCVPDGVFCGNYLPNEPPQGYGKCSAAAQYGKPCCNGLALTSDGICGCPVCNPVDPSSPSLVSPANNSFLGNNDVNLAWAQNGPWGTGCPTSNNRYKVYISQNCTTTYTNITTVIQSITTFTLNDLAWGGRYCWFVQKDNGGSSPQSSPVWEFRINTPPNIVNSGFKADACGNGISGRYDSLSLTKSNPGEYESNFIDADSDTFLDIQLVFVPVSAYNFQFGSAASILQYAVNANSVGVRLNTSSASLLRSGPAWGTPGTGGSIITNASGTGSILDSGTISRMITSGSGANANARIRFENTFNSGTYNIYIMGVTQNPDGTIVSTAATATENLIFTRVGTWRFDMTNPLAAVSAINFVGNNFSVQWSGSDASGIKNVYSYIWADEAGSVLQDITSGSTTINPLGLSELSYPASPNGLITAGAITATGNVLRNYNYSGLTVEYNFKLTIEDNACNIGENTSLVGTPKPWLTSRNGLVSANQGVSDIEIPSISATFVPNSSNSSILEDIGVPYFGDVTVLSGNNLLPSPNPTISEKNIYSISYNNQAFQPDSRSGSTNWYSYLDQLLSKNIDTSRVANENSATRTINGGNISPYLDSLLSTPSNTNDIYFIDAPLTNYILSGITCNRKVIFLAGGKITLEGDILRSGSGGCIFVSKEDVEISSGIKKTNVPLSTGGNSQYDIIEAYILTDKTLVVPEDQDFSTDASASDDQWDGVFIKGGLIALDVNIDRTLNSTGNGDQPAFVVQYDPFYSYVFRDAFALRYYSIREFVP